MEPTVLVLFENNHTNVIWKQSYNIHLETIAQVSLGNNNCASFNWKKIVTMSLGNNYASLTREESCAIFTWKEPCQFHLGTIVPDSFGKNCVKVIQEQLRQSHLEIIVLVLLRNNPASLSQKQPCQFHLKMH